MKNITNKESEKPKKKQRKIYKLNTNDEIVWDKRTRRMVRIIPEDEMDIQYDDDGNIRYDSRGYIIYRDYFGEFTHHHGEKHYRGNTRRTICDFIILFPLIFVRYILSLMLSEREADCILTLLLQPWFYLSLRWICGQEMDTDFVNDFIKSVKEENDYYKKNWWKIHKEEKENQQRIWDAKEEACKEIRKYTRCYYKARIVAKVVKEVQIKSILSGEGRILSVEEIEAYKNMICKGEPIDMIKGCKILDTNLEELSKNKRLRRSLCKRK